jgi:hypothetical protein
MKTTDVAKLFGGALSAKLKEGRRTDNYFNEMISYDWRDAKKCLVSGGYPSTQVARFEFVCPEGYEAPLMHRTFLAEAGYRGMIFCCNKLAGRGLAKRQHFYFDPRFSHQESWVPRVE